MVTPFQGTSAIDLSDALFVQSGYGDTQAIQTIAPNTIQVRHKAKFAKICFDSCDGTKDRKYFWVLENSWEANYPTACAIPGVPCKVPPNCLCPGEDHIWKQYYDRGAYNKQDFYRSIGCISGDATVIDNEIKQVCLCMTMPSCCSQLTSGWFNCCYGERVRLLPYEKFCWCCSVRAGSCQNCCRLCGPESGQPCECFLLPLAIHLASGESAKVALQINTVRAQWQQRNPGK